MVRPRQVTDERILEAARDVFLEHGPKAPVSMIAGRVGVSDAAVFKRFGTKQDLILAAMLPPETPPFVSLIADGPGPGDIRDQLIGVASSIAETLSRIVPHMSVLRAAGLDHRDAFARYDVPPPVRAHRALTGWLAEAQRQGRLSDAVDPATVAMTIMGAMHFRLFMCNVLDGAALAPALLGHLPDPVEYGRRVVEGLWSGLAPTEADR